MSSETSFSSDAAVVLEGQLRECFGRVVYSHKTHEKCADIVERRLAVIKLWQIGLSAATTVGFVAAFFGSGKVATILGVIISGVLLALNTYTKDDDLGQIAQRHREAANDLWWVREKYLALITDLRTGSKPLQVIQEGRDELLDVLRSVYGGAPSTNSRGYQLAQTALQVNEEMTFSDAELDAMLPSAVRKGR